MITIFENINEKNLIDKMEQDRADFELYKIPYEKWIKIQDKKTDSNGNRERKYSLVITELAEYLKCNLHYYFVRDESNESAIMYVYTNGVYVRVSDDDFKAFIKKFIPYQLIKMSEINEIYQNIKTSFMSISHEELNKDENIINFKDGLLYLDKMELKPHSYEILSTIQLPINYKEVEIADDKAPIFEKYIMNLLDNDVDTYIFMMEFIGLCISNIYGFRTKKSLFLIGKGNTGKSQLKSLVERLVGSSNISTTELKDLNERFGTSTIYQKRLVGSNDLTYQRVTDMNIFKQLTGGDKVIVEFKGKPAFNYLYRGALWFNGNKLPLFGGDDGEWVYERIMPVFCENVIPPEKRDSKLLDKMWEERNSIIKLALFFLQKLINDNYKFHEPKNMISHREKYERKNSDLLTFIEQYCIVDDNLFGKQRAKKSEFKKAFYQYCEINNNGRGKIKIADILEILKSKYKTEVKLLDGVQRLSNIGFNKTELNEDGIYVYNE